MFIILSEKDLKYVLDHCTKITDIFVALLDSGLLENISSHLALKGFLCINEEVSLEQLKTKLPNLTEVHFGHVSNEYLTKFCRDFPLLTDLWLSSGYDIQGSDNLSTAISLLRNLCTLHLRNGFTPDQVNTILQNLTNLEGFAPGDVTLSHQSFLCLARMLRLHTLSINLETGYRNLHLLTNKTNFTELKCLTIDDSNDTPDFWNDEVQTQLAKHRSTLKVEILRD